MNKIKIIFTIALIFILLATPTLGFRKASDYAKNMGQATDVLSDLVSEGKVPHGAYNMLSIGGSVYKKRITGNFSENMVVHGVLDQVYIVIHGNGTKLGPANATQFSANNQTVTALNLHYYPRNITLTFKGYEWWNNSNQHIVNNTGVTISTAPLYENNGTAYVVDYYTTNNPIWQSKHTNITLNLTTAWLQLNTDTFAQNISIVYNITIDDGTFTAFRLLNNSFYVAPNASLAATQDDLNIYVSNDSGTTWYLVVDGADGLTSTGTQWTGIVDLLTYAQGKSSLLINITFGSDGADDAVGLPDLHFDNFSIIVAVSKLPTRNPKVDLDNDGTWDYGTTGSLINTSSVSVVIGDLALNLTNNIKVYAEGSQKVFINFTWNDENRTVLKLLTIGDNTTNLTHKFLANGTNLTLNLLMNKTLYGHIPVTIITDEHSKMRSYNFSLTMNSYKYMCIKRATFTVSSDTGITVISHEDINISEPIPVFIKPRVGSVTVSVNVWNPSAVVGAELFNSTISSENHSAVVDIMITDIPDGISQVDLYIDGGYVRTINVTNDVVYLNVTGFSERVITLLPSTAALVAPPPEYDWYTIASIIAIAALFITLLYLFVATVRGR